MMLVRLDPAEVYGRGASARALSALRGAINSLWRSAPMAAASRRPPPRTPGVLCEFRCGEREIDRHLVPGTGSTARPEPSTFCFAAKPPSSAARTCRALHEAPRHPIGGTTAHTRHAPPALDHTAALKGKFQFHESTTARRRREHGSCSSPDLSGRCELSLPFSKAKKLFLA